MMKLLTLATYQRMMAAIEWVERQLQDKHGAGFRPRHEPGGPAFLKTTGDYVGDGLYDARRLNHNLEEMDPPVEVLVRNIMEQGQALPGESSQRHGIVAGTILFGWPGGILHDRVIYNVQWDVSAVRPSKSAASPIRARTIGRRSIRPSSARIYDRDRNHPPLRRRRARGCAARPEPRKDGRAGVCLQPARWHHPGRTEGSLYALGFILLRGM
jgi:hypothetical protein